MLSSTSPLAIATPPAPPASPSIECLIGELVAGAACLVAQGLGEFGHGGQINTDTRLQGGKLIEMLYELRRGFVGGMDFDHVAKTQGVRVLRERYGDVVDARTIEALVVAAVDILGRIVRLRLN